MKIRDRNVSSDNTVPATDDNFGGSTGLARTMQGSADMCTFIPVLHIKRMRGGGGGGGDGEMGEEMLVQHFETNP